jgi:hypothetical protein
VLNNNNNISNIAKILLGASGKSGLNINSNKDTNTNKDGSKKGSSNNLKSYNKKN